VEKKSRENFNYNIKLYSLLMKCFVISVEPKNTFLNKSLNFLVKTLLFNYPIINFQFSTDILINNKNILKI